ncbi:hypothetical protein C3V36_05285 [Lachnospiraceae bacterium oral taxon 500]|nr:hypothetical protein C3V36_05285 [Lachnospiraceae bacterium oral taxon 500]
MVVVRFCRRKRRFFLTGFLLRRFFEYGPAPLLFGRRRARPSRKVRRSGKALGYYISFEGREQEETGRRSLYAG